jgi:dienelactone hydrolase
VHYLLLLAFLWAAPKPDWDAMRQQIRQTLHVPDPLPNLAHRTYGHFALTKDVAADRVSFVTDYGLRVPAIVYHQAGVTITKHPALIIVNGHGGDKSSWYAYWAGILYARAGAVVLTYDPIGEYERNWQKRSGTRQHDTPLAPDDMAKRLAGLMITDIMQGARYLAERTDVDPKNIAVLGYSTGSLISSFACALDTSLRACVLVGAADDFHGEESLANLHEQTAALLASKKDVFAEPQPSFLTKPVALWLNEKLKFPNWTKKQLQAMPESPAPEGGFMVLGTDIPTVPRADLRAIPDIVWDAEQDNYIYETWRARANAALNQ